MTTYTVTLDGDRERAMNQRGEAFVQYVVDREADALIPGMVQAEREAKLAALEEMMAADPKLQVAVEAKLAETAVVVDAAVIE